MQQIQVLLLEFYGFVFYKKFPSAAESSDTEHEDTEGWPYTKEMGEKWVFLEKGDSLRVEGMKLFMGNPAPWKRSRWEAGLRKAAAKEAGHWHRASALVMFSPPSHRRGKEPPDFREQCNLHYVYQEIGWTEDWWIFLFHTHQAPRL